jgi:hypothetical protein
MIHNPERVVSVMASNPAGIEREPFVRLNLSSSGNLPLMHDRKTRNESGPAHVIICLFLLVHHFGVNDGAFFLAAGLLAATTRFGAGFSAGLRTFAAAGLGFFGSGLV